MFKNSASAFTFVRVWTAELIVVVGKDDLKTHALCLLILFGTVECRFPSQKYEYLLNLLMPEWRVLSTLSALPPI